MGDCYRLWVKHWHENRIGEQGEGPWLDKGTFPTEEATVQESRKYPYFDGELHGSWVRIEKVPAGPCEVEQIYTDLGGEG